MWTYRAPVADMLHLMTRVLDAPADVGRPAGLRRPGRRHRTPGAGSRPLALPARCWQPINASGDLQGCSWTPDGVRTPQGFADAYAAFVQGGWPALACAPEPAARACHSC
jgi:hypothetical protein